MWSWRHSTATAFYRTLRRCKNYFCLCRLYKFSLLWQQGLIWVIFACTFKSANHENTTQRKNSVLISVTSRVMANFVYKFIIFRYCVNKGWSSKKLNDNVQVANTKTPLFGAKLWGPMSQLMANLVLKHQICFYHSTSGSSAETWLTVKLIDLQNTQFCVQKIWDLS